MSTTKKAARERGVLMLAAGLLILFYCLPATESLSHEALCALGIFLASLTMWIGISIDWPSLITIFLIGFLPSFGFRNAFSSAFGNSTVAFLMFTFMLVYPLGQTSFVRRCTVSFITNRIARKGPWFFIAFLFTAVTVMGLFISPSVLFVAFMPFLEDIYTVLEIPKGSRTANMMMLGTAFCISMSSGMTPIGHVWPVLAMGYYASATGNVINSFQYMAIGIPTGILLLILLLLLFRYVYRPDDIGQLDPQKAMALKGSVPPADRKEKIVLGTMALTVFLWIAPSLVRGIAPEFYNTVNSWTTAMPPLLGCIILFLAKADGKQIMNFKEVTTKGIMWGSILMTAAATIIGSCLTNEDIGISAWLSGIMSPIANNLSAGLLVLFFVAWTVIETNFSSNIVTTTLVSSVALAVLTALPEGTVSVPTVLCLIGFSAGICNMTPAGQTTINTVAIGSGWTDARSMFVWGGIFALLAIVVMSTVGYGLGTLVM